MSDYIKNVPNMLVTKSKSLVPVHVVLFASTFIRDSNIMEGNFVAYFY